MTGIVCSMVGATFSVAAAAEVLRAKKGISAVGNAQISTAQSKFGGASAYFDGTDDALKVSKNDLFTGDFTVEFWYRPTDTPSSYRTMFCNGDWTGTGAWNIGQYGTQIFVSNYGASSYLFANSAVSANTWAHIAVVRSGSTMSLYINGTSAASTTKSGTMGIENTYYWIGNLSTLSDDVNGYIDEIRVSNSARYTSNFTPSTTPFVNDANTLLLIHADGTNASTFFEDDNGVRAQKGITANGTASISTSQSKFGGTSLYPNTGYLSTPYVSDLTITGNYTIECWVYATTVDTNYRNFYSQNDGGANYFSFYYQSSAGWGAEWAHSSGNYGFTRTGSSPLNTWRHFAFVKNGSTCSIYVDGSLMGATYSGGDGKALTSEVRIGQFSVSGNTWAGYIDEFRVSNTARYTTTFTPSTTPFVNDANTLLLMHMDGTSGSTVFRDDNGTGRSQVALIPNSSAQISTAASKFGNSSALFNRTAPNDWVKTADTSAFVIENYTSWTIEFWIRFLNAQSDNFPISTSDDKFNMRIQSSGSCNFNTQGSSPAWTKTHTTGTWYHYAIVKTSDGTVTVYLDGVSQGTGSIGGITPSTRAFYIGDRFDTGYCMDGYMDEVRFSNTARYTTTFTPSTTPFQNDSNTILLMHMEGTNGSTVFTDDNGKTPV